MTRRQLIYFVALRRWLRLRFSDGRLEFPLHHPEAVGRCGTAAPTRAFGGQPGGGRHALTEHADGRSYVPDNARPGMTLREIGAVLGVTGQRVREIEASALRKLRHPKRARLLREIPT